MPSPGVTGRLDALKSEMSPLQQRLLATYMDALADQEDDEPEEVEEEAAPEPPPPEPAYTGKSRSDAYAKKMSELLLKGWKMLGENCPETGDVPLMQHPTSGRKFSIATGRYTDEPKPAEAAPPKAPSPAKNPSPAKSATSPRPTVGFPSGLAETTSSPKRAAVEPVKMAAPGQRDDDEACSDMSALMLKGWKMLNETCPFTGLVPLMEHPTNGRKYSTAAKQFTDEVAKSAAAAAAAAGDEEEDDDDEVEVEDGEAWASVAVPGRLPRAAPPPPPPSRVMSSVLSSNGVSPAGKRGFSGRAGDSVSAQSVAALDAAEAAVASQLSSSAAMLASAQSPPPRGLLETISALAGTVEALAKARKACM